MKTRYAADALVDWGEPEEDGCVDIDAIRYKTFYGQTLDDAVRAAEEASLTGEAYAVALEEYRDTWHDWTIVEAIDPYDR